MNARKSQLGRRRFLQGSAALAAGAGLGVARAAGTADTSTWQQTVDVLTGAYRAYRQRMHHLSLEAAETVVPATEFAETRAAVSAIWDQVMGK